MKNFMTANTYKAMLDKEAERIEGIMQDGGSIYNPNTQLQQMYADDIAQQQQQFKKDWKVFGDAFAQTAMANQKPVQQPVQQQVKQEMDPSFAQYTDAMPNTGFGSGQSDYSFGQNYDHSFGRGTFGQGGAYLPMAQSGANLRANVPIPTAEQRAAQLAGLNYDVLAKPWIAAGDPTKMAQFRQEYPNVPTFSDISGSKDVATGYWDRVADWWGRKETPGYFSPQDEEEIMQDPRMSEAARKLLFQSPEATNMFDYAQTLFLTPQNMMNKVLTGYYESPGTTLQRYYPDMSTNSKVATDIFTDPLIVKSLVGKGLMQIPKIGTALKPYVVKAGELAKKYGKEAAEFAATYGKKGFIKSVEAAEKLAEYYAKNPWLQNVTEEVAMKIPQALMHMPKDDESKQAHLEAQMRAKIMKEMGTPQVMPSTRQGQVPQVNVQPVSQDPFSHMSTEEMEAILGARKYGGDTPKYQEAGNVPIMMQPYYSPETRQAMGMALANRRAQALMNPQFFPASGQQTTTPWTPPTISLSDADIANANILLQGPNTPEAALARRFGINPNYQQMYANDPTISSAANAARAGDAGATKKKVATTKKEQEQQARAEAEGAGTTTDPNKKRGNVPADETGKETTTTTDGKTVQTAHAPGYGGGRFKMKGRDPITGKRFKVKYDTRYSPREFYGGRGPRVVKYDIYNNPVYTDAYMNENYGPDAVTPEEQAIVDNAAMADAVPGWVTDPVGYKTPPPMDAGMGVLATVPSPYALGYGPWSPDPNAEVNQYAETLSTYDDPNAPGMGGGAQGRGRGIFGGGRQRGVNPARSNRIERRFQRQLARDEARGYQQGGGLWGDQQPLIYPGGMPDPNLNAAPYFQDGGGIFGWNPFGSASTDDEAYATGDVVDGKLAVTRSDARQMRRDSRPDAKAKWKGDNSGINQWAPMLPAAGHLTASIIEGIDPFGKNKKREAQFEAMHRADAVFTPNTQRDLGKHTVNQGYFDPYNMVPVQFPGMDQGAWGTPDTFAQYGGQYGTPQEMQMMPDSVAGPGGYGTMGEYRMANPDVQRGWMEWAESLQGQRPAQPQQPQRPQAQVLQPRTGIPPRPVNPGMYQQGGEMYLDENEIAQILAMGGQVEYV
jgi:hypothetical protein